MTERDWEEKLKDAARETVAKLDSSSAFISLFSASMAEEPLPALQLGVAMLLDKPIYVLVPEGVELPENLKKVAVRIEYYKRDPNDMTSFQAAAERLMKDWGKP